MINYIISSIYVQQQINWLLRMQKKIRTRLCQWYCNFFVYQEKHETHLREIFVVLTNNNIFIKLTKIYLKYSNVVLFDQKINSLKFVIFEKKLKIIAKLHFSRIFQQLKSYLNLTNWLRNYISHYVNVLKLFQNKKIELFSNDFVVENARRNYFSNFRFQYFTKQKLILFDVLQNILTIFFIWFIRIQKNYYFSILTSTRNLILMLYFIIWKSFFIKTMTNIFFNTSSN